MIPAFSAGLATRFGLHYKPESKGLYILEEFLVVLSVSCRPSL